MKLRIHSEFSELRKEMDYSKLPVDGYLTIDTGKLGNWTEVLVPRLSIYPPDVCRVKMEMESIRCNNNTDHGTETGSNLVENRTKNRYGRGSGFDYLFRQS